MGFVCNNSMKLFDPYPGSVTQSRPVRRTTGMVPTMLFRDGKPAIVVGAPGGSVIISAVLQSILNIVDFGCHHGGITVPRIHCEGAGLHLEARVRGSVCRELAVMGHDARRSAISFDPVVSRGMSSKSRRTEAGAGRRSAGRRRCRDCALELPAAPLSTSFGNMAWTPLCWLTSWVQFMSQVIEQSE